MDFNENEYEIYAQSNNQGWTAITPKRRYFTKDRNKAISYMKYLNEHETEAQEWRIALRVKNRIIFDLDIDNLENVKSIINYYKFLGEFKIFKTNGGYHIHSKRIYNNEWDWHYDCCRVLFPILETSQIISYIGKLNEWYMKKLREEFEMGWTKTEYIENIKKTFPESGLYCGHGDFDIIFSLLVIFKGYYCVRLSKKSKGDKVVLIEL